jgi:SIR2-like domain
MQPYDPLRAAFEIREQLASEKRKLAFFLGAGTSMAVGLPGIKDLTAKVEARLLGEEQTCFRSILKNLPEGSNVEQALDRIRIYRELIGEDEKKEFDGIRGASAARKLDTSVCQAISQCVREDPPGGLTPHLILSQWIRALHSSRDFPVEIYTTNYDLLMEQAMEFSGVPFFDGFIGSVAPFFVPECVEPDQGRTDESVYPPRSWTRLWKLHGSINWHLKGSPKTGGSRITRLSNLGANPGDELVIFPSRDKYTESRKLPFLSFQDRLRKFLSRGECLLIVLGYSFSDEHLNNIVFQGLRSNPRSAVMAFVYGEMQKANGSNFVLPEKFLSYGGEFRNLSLYGPDKVCVGGVAVPWDKPGRKRKDSEVWSFWDETGKSFTLGNFNSFTKFLETFIGFQPASHQQTKVIEPTAPGEPAFF